jgi:hypothetical protein
MGHGNLGKKSAKLTTLEVTTYSHMFASMHFDKQIHVLWEICQNLHIDDYPWPLLQLLHKFRRKTHTHTQTHITMTEWTTTRLKWHYLTQQQQQSSRSYKGKAKAKELVNLSLSLSLSITCCRHEEEVEEATAAYIIISRLFPLGQLGCCCCCYCCCFVRESVL